MKRKWSPLAVMLPSFVRPSVRPLIPNESQRSASPSVQSQRLCALWAAHATVRSSTSLFQERHLYQQESLLPYTCIRKSVFGSKSVYMFFSRQVSFAFAEFLSLNLLPLQPNSSSDLSTAQGL